MLARLAGLERHQSRGNVGVIHSRAFMTFAAPRSFLGPAVRASSMHRAFSGFSGRQCSRPFIFPRSAIKPVFFQGACRNYIMATSNGANGVTDSRPVFFFDIDNCVSRNIGLKFELIGLAKNEPCRSFIRKVRGQCPTRSTNAILTGGRRM